MERGAASYFAIFCYPYLTKLKRDPGLHLKWEHALTLISFHLDFTLDFTVL